MSAARGGGPNRSSRSGTKKRVDISGKLDMMLKKKAMGCVRVDLHPCLGNQSGEQIRVVREDHRVAVTGGDEQWHLDGIEPLQQRVVGNSPRTDCVVLGLAGFPRCRLVAILRLAEDAARGLLSCLETRAGGSFEEHLEVAIGV